MSQHSSEKAAKGKKRQKLDDNNYKEVGEANDQGDSDEDEDSKIKWQTLEHHGMTFPPPY